MWTTFLEFLIIVEGIWQHENNGEDLVWNSEYVAKLFKNYRIIYIKSSKSWRQLIHFIFGTNTDGLNPNGKIILITHGEKPSTPDGITEKQNRIVPFITNALADQPEAITNASNKLNNNIPIIHLLKLHDESIVDNELELKDLNMIQHKDEILGLVINNYQKYLGCEN